MARWAKLLPATSACHTRAPIPLAAQLSANASGKAAEQGPSTWVPDTHLRDVIEVWLLALVWPKPGCLSHFRNEAADERYLGVCAYVCLPLSLPFCFSEK